MQLVQQCHGHEHNVRKVLGNVFVVRRELLCLACNRDHVLARLGVERQNVQRFERLQRRLQLLVGLQRHGVLEAQQGLAHLALRTAKAAVV